MQFIDQLARRTSTTLVVGLLALLVGCAALETDARGSTADASGGRSLGFSARTIALSETGHLRAVGHGGSTIEEQGEATGTYDCSITVHLVIASAERVTATFTVRPRGGTVSGSGSAAFSVEGAYGYVGGTLKITRGTGIFVHASGRAIGFSGRFNRETFSATVHVHGTVRT
jgi:hypothetical protein